MLSIKKLSSSQSSLKLEGVSAKFDKGKIYTILGRTGAGKTELLRTLIGLDESDSGSIHLDDIDITHLPIRVRNMAMVYQQFINYPHLNVLENVAFPLYRQKINKNDLLKRARAALRLVGLSDFEERMPAQLSGGQQQRVAIARAIVKQARILLLDEPLANLDYKLREQLREEFPRLLHKNSDGIILYTTTEPAEAMQLGDELIVMHEGKFVAQGDPLLLFKDPPNLEVARIISDPPISIFEAVISDGKLSFMNGFRLFTNSLNGLKDGSVKVGIRPDSFELGGDIPAQVKLTEFSGSDTIVHLRLPFGDATMLLDGIQTINTDTTLKISINTKHLLIFSPQGKTISWRTN
ncbi:MAG: ABC transporter ATP-binding protein [Oceanospirillaceae bacterium]|nr:ABC transporter ATP-binding protein [Oceanospirillaceae bacterium]